VRRRVARFVLDQVDTIASTHVDRPPGLHDRGWNNWRPLLAFAAVAVPTWLERAENAAVALAGSDDDVEAEDLQTLALRHVWEIVQPIGKVKTADVLRELVARDDGGPWARWWERDLADGRLKGPAARLAALLRQFGIGPTQLWIDGNNERGYDAQDFTDPRVAPYLEQDARTLEEARHDSNSHAASSDPYRPSELSEPAAPTSLPPAGADGFLEHLDRALANGQITPAQRHELRLQHFHQRRIINESNE
jgi:hypothetical protein